MILAFLIGLICPHDGGFAIKLTEKIEDLVSVIFLPLYFALSGLGTNLGALNDGITWGYVIGVIAIAFAGKIIGGTLAARANKLVWRESFTIGCLMSCKGLVELIVLVSDPSKNAMAATDRNRTSGYKPGFYPPEHSPCSLLWRSSPQSQQPHWSLHCTHRGIRRNLKLGREERLIGKETV